VKAPKFALTKGSFFIEEKLAISSETPGAKIYYTLDGSKPTVNSILYSEPISITPILTLRAYAVAAGYTDSKIDMFRIMPNTPNKRGNGLMLRGC
jgi:chitinase